MSARKGCKNFFRNSLVPFHKYRQNVLIDATTPLINGASLTLTSHRTLFTGLGPGQK